MSRDLRVCFCSAETTPGEMLFHISRCALPRRQAAAFAAPTALPARNQRTHVAVSPRRPLRPLMALPNVAAKSLKVLVVGSGGREHALVDAVARSQYVSEVVAAPGNVGMDDVALCRRVDVGAEDVDGLVRLAKAEAAGLVVVGPEVPLVGGLVDRLMAAGILAFGPTAEAAILEGSKAFTKDFLARHGIPTAWYGRFTDAEEAKAFVRERGTPIVVKADGLAAGKGVIIAATVEEACAAVDDILVGGAFGEAGTELIVEEFLEGEEVSFFALIDGNTAVPLASCQDHKAAGDGDTGPNTGGMGAYSPAPICDDALKRDIMERVVMPTMEGMAAEGRTFRGVLYCGMMVDKKTGAFKVLECMCWERDAYSNSQCTSRHLILTSLLHFLSARSLIQSTSDLVTRNARCCASA
jgi:phosphoribosylamine--glycine ligase